MRISNALVLLFLTLWCLNLTAQTAETLPAQLKSIKVHTALLFPSQAIDESPVWSPDSRYLAANVQGKWFKLDTSAVQLRHAQWHGKNIGIVVESQKFEPTTEPEVTGWTKRGKQSAKMQSNSGVEVEMKQDELSTAFVLTQGKRKRVLWKSDLENCGALTVSPDGRFAAYICETNGVFVTDIDGAFKNNQ